MRRARGLVRKEVGLNDRRVLRDGIMCAPPLTLTGLARKLYVPDFRAIEKCDARLRQPFKGLKGATRTADPLQRIKLTGRRAKRTAH
jgi:hypothetical protein